jgi:hypothetical protein
MCAFVAHETVQIILHLLPCVFRVFWGGNHTNITGMHLPAGRGSSTLWQPSERLFRKAVPRQIYWEGGVISHGFPGYHIWPLLISYYGYIENLMYQKNMQHLEKLHCRITAACDTVTPGMLQNTCREVEYGLDMCRSVSEAHVGIYWETLELRNFLQLSHQFLNGLGNKKLWYW